VERANLRLSVERGDTETLVVLAGELDMSTVGQLSDAVTVELEQRPSQIVLDIADVTFCDSLGLGTIVVLSRAAQAQRARLILRNPNPFFTRMLEVTGLSAGLTVSNGQTAG
jgi:anti-sigma B factor antagonist